MSLEERLRLGHEEWLAHGGRPDGVSSDERGSSVDEPLHDLGYPPCDSDSESNSDREDRLCRFRNEVGTPVPEYPELPPYEP